MNAARPTSWRSRLRHRSRPASAAGKSRLGNRATVQGRRSRPALILGAAVVIVLTAGVASIVVLPLQNYVAQGDEITRLETELGRLEAVNADLAAEVARLRTDDGIREAARDELGYVADGEVRQTVLGLGGLPIDLPNGWPYGGLADIIAVRSAGS